MKESKTIGRNCEIINYQWHTLHWALCYIIERHNINPLMSEHMATEAREKKTPNMEAYVAQNLSSTNFAVLDM